MFKRKVSKWPTRKQWRQFFKVLTKKEKITFFIFYFLLISSLIFLCFSFYLKGTTIAPAKGGTHIEGVIGQPRFINPVYANSDPDRDLVQLVFSGLMKYDQDLNVVPDLAEKYEIEQEGKVYKFYLKENLRWQDSKPITADDIIFTIQTIQNPDFKSPLQANWVGIEVEKINDLVIRFTLKKPYSAFLENCTLGILPEHIWTGIEPENFAFESYNLEPIGSGPYKLKDSKKERSNQISFLELIRNPLYHGQKPYISKIKFLFFNNEEELIKAAQKRKIKGFSLNYQAELGTNWENYTLSLPRYFAVFFNQEKSKILDQKDIRLALNYAINKEEIDQKIVESPILPEIYGFEPPLEIYPFDIEKAKEILEKAGFKDEDQDGLRQKVIVKNPAFTFKRTLSKGSQGTEVTELQKCLAKLPDIYPEKEISGYFGSKTERAVNKFQQEYLGETTGTTGPKTRAKLNEVCFGEPDEVLELKFTLVTVNQPEMIKTGEILKEQWKKIGAEVKIQTYSLFQLEQDFIKPREYDALLFGEVLSAIPDPFPFWHSTQTQDPGLNLALYENEKADQLLEENRKSSDPEVRAKKLEAFQELVIQDAPALFLYNPDYIYSISKEIKGVDVKKIVDPSRRFSGIENWHIETRRTWR
jgi:peptide/nickel transport system substrate-binding protein